MRRRLEALLAKIEAGKRAPEEIQALRAIEILEMLNTPAARAVLKELAAGAKGSELTTEARSALDRLARRPPEGP
jgi:hypothetical protein